MMRSIFYLLLICICSDGYAQTNLFTIGDNGDFETENSEDVMGAVVFDWTSDDWIIERIAATSVHPAASGSYFIKCTMGNASHPGLRELVSIPFLTTTAGKGYVVRAQVWVPEASNIQVWATVNKNSTFGEGWHGPCKGELFNGPPGDPIDNYNEWVETYFSKTVFENVPLHFVGVIQNMSFDEQYLYGKSFYLDNIEVYEYQPINASVEVDYEINSVMISDLSGGFTGASEGEYRFTWNDGSTLKNRTNLQNNFHYELTITKDIDKPELVEYTGGCFKRIFSFYFPGTDPIPLCTTSIPKGPDGTLKLDKFSGQVVLKPVQNCFEDIQIGCISGKLEAPQFNKVVSASAVTYNDAWDYDNTMFRNPGGTVSANPYENASRGKWRPQSSYAYKTDQITRDKNYNTGTFQLSHFNWDYPAASERLGWLKTNTVEKYTPHGNPVQERNAIDIPSVAKFGYHDAVPYLIAQNAEYSSVLFESFESVYGASVEDGFDLSGGTVLSTVAHSGKNSFSMNGNASMLVRSFTINKQIKSKGMLAKVWVRDNPSVSLNLQMNYEGSSISAAFTKVVRTGDWTLYQAMLNHEAFDAVPFDPQAGSQQAVSTLHLVNAASEPLWIDDLRIQPQDAEMTAYVYDKKTLRLVTVFDDQHFGLYYQYNPEGQLVRKIIETEQGRKTIQETQYNTPVVQKSTLPNN